VPDGTKTSRIWNDYGACLQAGVVGHQLCFGRLREDVVATVFRINQLGVEVVEYHQQPVSNIKEHFTLQVSLGSLLIKCF